MESKNKYDLGDPLPANLAEARRQIEYWMSRQNEGEVGSNWEHLVRNKLEQLRWKELQLAAPAVGRVPQDSSSHVPVIFLSCGQYKEEEKALGSQVKALLEGKGAPEVYFAENQSSLEALTKNILGALDRCVGFIGIMHKRGEVAATPGPITRASVWIEQEIAVAAFIAQILNRKIEVQLYVQGGICLEGMRDKLMLNSHPFTENIDVVEHLGKDIDRWRALAGRSVTPDPLPETKYAEDFARTKPSFYVRKKRERDGQEIRSGTYFLLSIVPANFPRLDTDVSVRDAFIEDIYQAFRFHKALAQSQGTHMAAGVAYDGAREFSLPIVTHDHDRRWGFTQQGTVRFASQSVWSLAEPPNQLWSASDTIIDLLSFLTLTANFWRINNHKGTARLYAELNVGKAELSEESPGYTSLLGQLLTAVPEVFVLDHRALLSTGSPRSLSHVFEDISSNDLNVVITDFAARVAGQVFGGLGYEVDLQRLRDFVKRIATTEPKEKS